MTEGFPAETVTTARLRLRPFRPADATDVQRACSDPLIQRWLPLPDPYTAADALSWVSEGAPAVWAGGTGASFAAVSAQDGRLVGSFGLSKVDWRHQRGEIGYWVAPWARGRGYAPEAARALAEWGFAHGLRRVELLAAPRNAASQRVALKAGFSREGVRRSAGAIHEGRVDVVAFALLPGDPPGQAKRRLPDVDTLTDGVVTVRPVRPADAPALHTSRIDRQSVQWTPVFDPPAPEPTPAQTLERIESAESDWLAGTAAAFAIVELASGQTAGDVTLRMTWPEIGTGEVGYGLAPAFRGRGLMRRALRLVTRWAFEQAGLARIEAGVGVANVPSLRTAEAAGFHREGVLRQALPGPTGRYDVVLFSLLPEDLTAPDHPLHT